MSQWNVLIRRLGQILSRKEAVSSAMLRGGAVSFLLSLSGVGLGLMTNLLLARLLGSAEYGGYAVAVGWAMLLAIPITFGMDFVILRFVPDYAAQGQGGVIRQLLLHACAYVVCLSALAFFLLYLIDAARPGSLGLGGAAGAALVAMLGGAQAGLMVFSATFRAIRSIFFSQFYQQILRAVVFLSLVALVAVLGLLDKVSAMEVTVLAAFGALAILALHLWVRFKRDFQFGQAVSVLSERNGWLAMAWPSLISALAQQVLMQGGLIALGASGTPVQAGYYAVAARLATLVTFPLSALASITAPMIVSAWSAKSPAELQSVATLNARLSFFAAVLAVVTILLLNRPVLGMFGPEFDNSFWPLAILMGGNLFVAFTGACANLLLMTGHQKTVALTMLFGVASQAIVLYALSMGGLDALGAAVAFATSVIVTNAGQTIACWRKLRINATAI